MLNNPQVGLVLLRDYRLDCSGGKTVLDSVERDTQDIVNRLERTFEVAGPWIVYSAESLEACLRGLRETRLDMVLLAFQTWAEESYLAPILEAAGAVPVVLWCYMPWRRMPRPASHNEVMRGSGPVGAFAALGTLRNMNADFFFTFGSPDDPRLLEDLREAGRAARARQGLRAARFGMLSGRAGEASTGSLPGLGSTILDLPVDDYRRMAEAVPEAQVAEYLRALQGEDGEGASTTGVSAETLRAGARSALGLAGLADLHDLHVLAVESASPQIQAVCGLRPALYPGLIQAADRHYLPECDAASAAAGFVLHFLSASPIMFLELWYWDEPKNQVVGGHSGFHNPAVATRGRLSVTADEDFCRPIESEGAQMQFLARPGRATLFQMRQTPKGWQAIALSAMVLEGQPWVRSYPHAIIRLDATISTFLNRIAAVGASQHWMLAYCSVLPELSAFCQMSGIPLEILTS